MQNDQKNNKSASNSVLVRCKYPTTHFRLRKKN